MELRLPSEYQEVEYIENTGTQYIITDLLFPKDLENPKIEWGFMQIVVPSGDNMIFGYWSNGSIYYEVYNSTTLSYASIGKNHYDRISNANLTKDMLIAGVMTKETMYLNEYSYAKNAEDTIDQSVRPMAIFAWNSSSGRTYTNKGARIYYLRFFNGNTKMADYVPCYRKLDGEIGMYDTVTKTFYTNAGTDTFLKGADITRYIDNVSVLDTRRKILLNTPHIDTSVGDLVTFSTDLSAPLKSCKVSFLPVQEGEGDPSPDNMRNIIGWNGVRVGLNNITTNINWTDEVGTVYGGYVDSVKGELVQTWYEFILDGVNNYLNSGSQLLNNGLVTIYDYIGSGGLNNLPRGPVNAYTGAIICNKFPLAYNRENEGIATGSGSLYIRLLLDPSKLEDVSSASAIRESMIKWQQENPLQIVYELAEPIHYQLTPQQLLTLKGINNVYSDANGQTEIKYWKH